MVPGTTSEGFPPFDVSEQGVSKYSSHTVYFYRMSLFRSVKPFLCDYYRDYEGAMLGGSPSANHTEPDLTCEVR